ncbi:formylglycine-generating enzyme family protein [Okeania sp.]|uniref:formylglycine-generating enzyme family protein n=1 Tax=Okeania sp. TaxID=3100323 RepID=UPI002B4AF73D|nr:formylglycine-generating enzyme family protein [Okeania sp.]MEB3343803.1 formylglycine-generating enzyme family protein [Okeania sp.]
MTQCLNPNCLKSNPPETIFCQSCGKKLILVEDLGNGIELEMVYIPGGTFFMGSPDNEEEKKENETPQHEVTLPPFYMSKYPITQEQYQVMMDKNPSIFRGKNRPVENVSWYDAIEFCQNLSTKTGKIYSLPSESQWEYASRAGTTTSSSELVNDDGNYPDAYVPKKEFRKETTDVGSFLPNTFGLYDMQGNVWEWCQDIWHDNYDGAPTDGSAWETQGDISTRVLRGGSWYYISLYCRYAKRSYDYVDFHSNVMGFRVVSFVSRS